MKEKIINSATGQIEKFGFRKFTLDAIAEDLGISKKTVYKYFDSKNHLISAVIELHLEVEKERVYQASQGDGTWIDRFENVVFCKKGRRKEHLIHELRRHFPEEWEKTKIMRSFHLEQMQKLLEEGQKHGDIRQDVNLATVVFLVDRAFDSLFNHNYDGVLEMDLEQTIKEVRNVVLYGILDRENNEKGPYDETKGK